MGWGGLGCTCTLTPNAMMNQNCLAQSLRFLSYPIGEIIYGERSSRATSRIAACFDASSATENRIANAMRCATDEVERARDVVRASLLLLHHLWMK